MVKIKFLWNNLKNLWDHGPWLPGYHAYNVVKFIYVVLIKPFRLTYIDSRFVIMMGKCNTNELKAEHRAE